MRNLLERYDFVDHYVDFPGYEGLPEQRYDAERTERLVLDMQKQNFDLLLQILTIFYEQALSYKGSACFNLHPERYKPQR